MHWGDFFQDLEDQLSAQHEADRAALDAEAERLRISRMGLRDRLRGIAAGGAPCRVELCDGLRVEAPIGPVGADWFSAAPGDGRLLLIRIDAIAGLGLDGPALVASAAAVQGDPLSDRVTFGFALRDLARRRVPLTIGGAAGRVLSGTLDRVAADHADLALHEPGGHRRRSEIRGFRVIPLEAIAWVRVEAGAGTALDG